MSNSLRITLVGITMVFVVVIGFLLFGRSSTMPGIIAFTTIRNGNYEMYLMEHGRTEELTSNPAYDGQPRLSPDGGTLLFNSDRDGNYDVYRMDLATRAITNLTNHPANDGKATWSSDGEEILFMSNRDAENEATFTPWIMSTDGSNSRRLAAPARLDIAQFSDLAPGSILGKRREGDLETFFVIDRTSGATRRFVPETSSLTGDCRGIVRPSAAYRRVVQGVAQYFLLDLSTGLGCQLTHARKEVVLMSIAPNDEWLLYREGTEIGKSRLVLESIDGKRERVINPKRGTIVAVHWR